MLSSPISNALLRVDNAVGIPPSPFEKPNDKMNFWVLELNSRDGDDVALWCSRTMKILVRQTKLLAELRDSGKYLTLFVEPSAIELTIRFEAAFLQALADQGISLELAKERGPN